MTPDRRQVLTMLGATVFGSIAARTFAADRFDLGGIRITTVSDGNLVLPGDFMFGGLPEEELADILMRHGVSRDEVHPPCNVTLLQDADRTILFDAGSGSGFMPSAGDLVDTLDALDVAPDDITHVVFTHAHPDHLWGVLDDFDDPVFTNASYLINQVEWDYWRDPDTVNTIGEARAAFAVGAARRLEAIEDACEFFTAGQEVLPGIMSHATYGHTPGHTSFEVRNGNDAVMVVGDAIANAHVAFERPDWASGSDQDTELGAATRQRLLDQLATDQIPMVGFHLPHGGLGRVTRKDGVFRFISEV
ncbi:putative quorum-quenching lactonase YtnP [Roseovarius litorisediminis]|uniref:Putative quorum-quenching lactonase YtnP n=1 Tax=Roseovarius litorisediminis TaxID=1312363 RepID=A0A1Y5RI25_9RHOB|nr:MBL fold metallo-hydrolase [Roseovarius litorisediminis]SLN15150.1 putative quorum-quenching lactonase YtnP [Roseovarius litorisediminis]